MPTFTQLEMAALRAIFAETPELAEVLGRQLELAVVTVRKSTSYGFFTTIAVPDCAP